MPKGPQASQDRPLRGRPRLTPEDLRDRMAAYCNRHGVALSDDGLPPFPAGRRETDQHREWMSLYKAQRRLSERGPSTIDITRRLDLLTGQHGRCAVCRKPLEIGDARLDDRKTDAAVLHETCLKLVELARSLGGDALDRVKARL